MRRVRLDRLSSTTRLAILAGAVAAIVLVAALVAIGILGSRCGGWSGCDADRLPLGPVSAAELDAHTESTLYYPGARLISHAANPEQDSPARNDVAHTVTLLATPDSPATVYSWYSQWTQAHHWRPINVLKSSVELSIRSWDRGTREVFDVAIMDPTILQKTFGDAIPTGQTIIETRYGILPPNTPHY